MMMMMMIMMINMIPRTILMMILKISRQIHPLFLIFQSFLRSVTDGGTEGRRDGGTDGQTRRVIEMRKPHLKMAANP